MPYIKDAASCLSVSISFYYYVSTSESYIHEHSKKEKKLQKIFIDLYRLIGMLQSQKYLKIRVVSTLKVEFN